MAQNYTRQSSFADGDTITAALFNNEFNQVVNAFAYSASSDSSTGHKHDGTSGQGGNIPQIGDIDFLNKIVVDSTNNRWGFYVQVSSGTVEQIRIQDGAIVPVTNNDIDLGTSSLEFKDLFLDGTAHIDTLDVDVNATVAGTLGVTGATTLSSTLGVTGAITGSSTLQATTITATTAFVPDASDGASLGTVSLEFSDLFLADGALIAFGDDQDVTLTHLADAGLLLNGARGLFFNDTTQYINAPNGTTLDIAATDEIELNATTIDINGAADVSGNLAVGGNLTVTGNATIAGNLTFGDAATDTVAFSADVASNLLPSVDNTYDLGASGSEWKDLYIDGTANIDSLVADTADINGGTIDSAVIGGTTPAAITGTAITATGIMTATGTSVFASLDISGDIDVDGTANLDVVDIDGAVDFGSTTAHAGNATFADNAKAIFGAGSDLQIYHDGSRSIIKDAGTGNLEIQAANLRIKNPSETKSYLNGNDGGAITVFYDGSQKLATTATGIDVTGTVTADGTASSSVPKYTFAGDVNTGLAYIGADAVGLLAAGSRKFYVNSTTGYFQNLSGGVNFGSGIDVTGTVTADAATFSGAVTIDANVDDQLTLSRAAGNNRILKYETAGVARWAVYADGVAEAGSDAGSDYQISYYNDAGVYQGNALTLTRATGAATFSGTVTADGLSVSTATGSATPVPTEIIIKSETDASDWSDTLPWGRVNFYSQDGSTNGPKTEAAIDVTKGGAGGGVSQLSMSTCNSTTGSLEKRISIEPDGDISFYEDTGTTAKFFWDASAESLGIGTTTVNSKFNVASSQDSLKYNEGVTVFRSTGSNKMFLNCVGGGANIVGSNSPITFNYHDQTTNNVTEAARIVSGNLLVGKDTTGLADAGFEVQSSGQITANQANAPAAKFNRLTNDGEIIRLHKDGATVGSIGSEGGDLTIGNADTGLQFVNTSQIIRPQNLTTNAAVDAQVSLGQSAYRFKDLYLSGGVRGTSTIDITIPETSGGAIQLEFGNNVNDTRRTVRAYKDNFEPAAADTGVISLGQAANKWKDLYLSGGVYLGGTGNGNLLNEYEIGSWTLVISGESGGSADTSLGYYKKIGNFVYCAAYINQTLDLTSLSGIVNFSLPFAGTSWHGGGSVVYANSFFSGTSETDTFIGTRTIGGQVRLVKGSSTSWISVGDIETASGSRAFMFEHSYQI
jgi:hypothetical protein